jgi:hypothetical protein
MLWTSRRKIIVKTIANRKCPIPNEAGFRFGSLLSMAMMLNPHCDRTTFCGRQARLPGAAGCGMAQHREKFAGIDSPLILADAVRTRKLVDRCNSNKVQAFILIQQTCNPVGALFAHLNKVSPAKRYPSWLTLLRFNY